MPRRPERPRAIAVSAPAPYTGPGHLVIVAALAVLLLLLLQLSHAHAGFFSPAGEAIVQSDVAPAPLATPPAGGSGF